MSLEPPYVLCIDVGSFDNIGWAASDGSSGSGADLDEALLRLSLKLRTNKRSAIGFEAPIWTPARSSLSTLTGSRSGVEKNYNRAWSAGAGCGSLGAALALMPYCFSRLVAAGPVSATVSLDSFMRTETLFVWEAFVSGAVKSPETSHCDDARLACDEFVRRWPFLNTDIPAELATNHAVSSAIAAGVQIDLDELRMAALVISPSRPHSPSQ